MCQSPQIFRYHAAPPRDTSRDQVARFNPRHTASGSLS